MRERLNVVVYSPFNTGGVEMRETQLLTHEKRGWLRAEEVSELL